MRRAIRFTAAATLGSILVMALILALTSPASKAAIGGEAGWQPVLEKS